MNQTGVGIIGCGFISDIYLKNMTADPSLAVVAVADLDPARARAKAEKYGIARACSPEDLFGDPAVTIVANLTTPDAHASVAFAAIAAGKSIYNEKPLAIALEDGKRLVAEAAAAGVRIGSAPDTFLGAGWQTCRALIDDGAIGKPVAGVASMLCHGHEGWHPEPDFYYQPGAGPLFDMGPYYLTALVSLLGPIGSVSAVARRSFPTRTITSQPNAGRQIEVNIPTHVAAVLDFAEGAVVSLTTSFDTWAKETRVEIYGSEGTLLCPDPNIFSGEIGLRTQTLEGSEAVAVTRPYAENSRGLGISDMAAAIREGRTQRCSGELSLHVLEAMHAIHQASEEGRAIELETTVARPEPLG